MAKREREMVWRLTNKYTINTHKLPLYLMSIDPYHAVQQEIETLLHNADQLFASYRRIRNIASSDSEELTYARNEVYITYLSTAYSPCLHCVLL